MLLAIDVGNTNIVFGLFDGDDLVGNWRVATDKNKTSDEYGIVFANILKYNNMNEKDINSIIISSVVPPLMLTLSNMVKMYFNVEPLIIGPGVKTGMNIKYDNPKEVGADRIVNAVAGYEKYGGPLIIIDMGTAITFCYISEKGDYEGGLILPGINISAEALFQRTAKLPKVEIVKPKSVVGKTTVESIQSGLYHGYVGIIDHIIEEIAKDENIDTEKLKVVSTGGLAKIFTEDSKYVNIVDELLTLEGLKRIYDKNI
ncbi:MAG: type III pantothenate kinase [Tissierellia bacterium]|nr:type III pantothenate kinase [Tissierellia bacterium]